MQEDDIQQKIREREEIIAGNVILPEQDMTKIQQEMQSEHQKVLFREAEASGDEKKKLTALRREIERQQQRVAIPEQRAYQSAVLNMTPKQTVLKNTLMAFLVGGIICTMGQIIKELFLRGGLADQAAGAATSALLIFLGAFFTAIGIYDELGQVAGAGSFVPITGFANSIVAAAIEFKREGFVYGVGARLFTVAGPVLAYGTIISILIGLIYYFIK